jgi:hypothetical protein
MIIVTNIGFNWPSSFRGEDLWRNRLRRTDGRKGVGRKVMANAHPGDPGELKRVANVKFVRLLVCWNSYTQRNEVFWPVRKSVGNVFVSDSPLTLLNGIYWNMVVFKDMTWRCACRKEILIRLFFYELCPFELRTFEICTTETVCDRFFSETTERNFLKLGSYYGNNM